MTHETIIEKRLQYMFPFIGDFLNPIEESLTMLHAPVTFIGRWFFPGFPLGQQNPGRSWTKQDGIQDAIYLGRPTERRKAKRKDTKDGVVSKLVL